MWCDNYGIHHKEELKVVWTEEKNVTLPFLPHNLTWLLEVIDIVVNGPI